LHGLMRVKVFAHRCRASDRAIANAIWYVLWTGCQWKAIHREWFGVSSSVVEVLSKVVDRLLQSRGYLLLASFHQLSIYELRSGSHQGHQMMPV
jgi:hypothetical protein